APLRHDAVGKALALVETRRADETKGRSFRQVLRQLAIVRQGSELAWFIDAVDALVGNERTRPLLVVLRIVLDQQHLPRLADGLAFLDEIDTRIGLRTFAESRGRRASARCPDAEQ